MDRWRKIGKVDSVRNHPSFRHGGRPATGHLEQKGPPPARVDYYQSSMSEEIHNTQLEDWWVLLVARSKGCKRSYYRQMLRKDPATFGVIFAAKVGARHEPSTATSFRKTCMLTQRQFAGCSLFVGTGPGVLGKIMPSHLQDRKDLDQLLFVKRHIIRDSTKCLRKC